MPADDLFARWPPPAAPRCCAALGRLSRLQTSSLFDRPALLLLQPCNKALQSSAKTTEPESGRRRQEPKKKKTHPTPTDGVVVGSDGVDSAAEERVVLEEGVPFGRLQQPPQITAAARKLGFYNPDLHHRRRRRRLCNDDAQSFFSPPPYIL